MRYDRLLGSCIRAVMVAACNGGSDDVIATSGTSQGTNVT